MLRSTKIMLITAGILIGLGMIIAGISIGISKVRGTFGSYNISEAHAAETTTIDEAFGSVSVTEISSDVTIMPTDKSKAYVEHTDSDSFEHLIRVKNNTLIVEFKDTSHWYEHVGISIPRLMGGETIADPGPVYIYLPKADYDKIDISTVSGDIDISSARGRHLDMTSTSGNISVKDCAVTNKTDLHTVSGSIYAENLTLDDTDIDSTSGDIRLNYTVCKDIDINTTSGDIFLNSYSAASTDIETTSGDIILNDYESLDTEISTTSGCIDGNLKGTYKISYDTLSGDVNIINNFSDGYPMSIETMSGDITLK